MYLIVIFVIASSGGQGNNSSLTGLSVLGSATSLKDRQQEVRAFLEGSRYISDCYVPFVIQYMHYIPLITLLSGLFIDIKHINIT